MSTHKLTLTEISWVTILCRHRDSNPRPSDSRLLAGHWFLYRGLHFSEWPVCPYWSPVQVFFSCFRPTKRSAPRFRFTIESGNDIRLSFLLFQVDPTLSIELERAQHFRASSFIRLWISGLNRARAWKFLDFGLRFHWAYYIKNLFFNFWVLVLIGLTRKLSPVKSGMELRWCELFFRPQAFEPGRVPVPAVHRSKAANEKNGFSA